MPHLRFILLLLLIHSISFLPCLAEDLEESKDTLDFQYQARDIRDTLLEAAAKGETALVIEPGIKGELALEIKKMSPDRAIALLAASVGCVVKKVGELTLVVRQEKASPPKLPPLKIRKDSKCKTRVIRSANLRVQFKSLANEAEIPVIVGREFESSCPIKVGEVPIADLMVALAWVSDARWTFLNEVLFIGTAQEVEMTKKAWEAR